MAEKFKHTLAQNNREDIEPPEALNCCPMCGGTAAAFLTSKYRLKYGEIGVAISCEKCRITTGVKYISSLHIDTLRKGAEYAFSVEPFVNLVKLWNKRTGNTKPLTGDAAV